MEAGKQQGKENLTKTTEALKKTSSGQLSDSKSLQDSLRHGVYVHPDCSVAIATAITNVVRGRCRDRPAAGMEPRRLPAALLACVCALAMAAGHPGGRPRGDFLSQRVANGSQRNAVKPTYTLSYRELYLEEACGGLANKAQRSHYLSLRDHKASMAIYSHRSGVLPRSVSKCRIQILTESHARLTISFVKLDTVEQPFICYMYLKIYMTDKPDLVCGKQATGKSISTSTSQMALEWVINNGGEKPGRIEMILTSYKESVGGRQDHTLILAIVVLVALFAVGTGIVFQIAYNRYSGRDIQTQYVVGPNLEQPGVVHVPKP
ncbi:uncharacterized protein LOC142575295 isoform X3 [Dermacentor variabilis]|uniref:uncharacterized protein LOC142575295 isoform X3 n=1 Tax=Dermacentor variabilis TaxID=34621 RepID=UPI003F5B2135